MAASVKVWKPHLVLRRFPKGSSDLTPGARRNHQQFPEDVYAEIAPTARSECHVCREKIPKGALRMTLMLQCHKGYKNRASLHLKCFRKHPEALKVTTIDEVAGLKALTTEQQTSIKAILNEKGSVKKERKRKVKKAEETAAAESSPKKAVRKAKK